MLKHHKVLSRKAFSSYWVQVNRITAHIRKTKQQTKNIQNHFTVSINCGLHHKFAETGQNNSDTLKETHQPISGKLFKKL